MKPEFKSELKEVKIILLQMKVHQGLYKNLKLDLLN